MTNTNTDTGTDPIQPAYYKSLNDWQAIDVIDAWELNFYLGNAVKYILRAGKKGPAKEDLEKAIWYLKREIYK